jgi:hypothetical protein
VPPPPPRKKPVITRLDRVTQYSRALMIDRKALEYQAPACAGVTALFVDRQCSTAVRAKP